MNKSIENYYTTTNEAKNTYICCFTQTADSLYMWNSYMKNTFQVGYCLGFNYEHLSRHLKLTGGFARYQYKVIYNKQDQEEIIRKLILDYNKLLEEDKDKSNESLTKVLCAFSHAFYTKAIFFKSPKFEIENEIRIVLVFDKTSEIQNLKNSGMLLQFRCNGSGIIVPYLEITFESNALEEVITSPYMTSKGYDGLLRLKDSDDRYNFNIKKSDVLF